MRRYVPTRFRPGPHAPETPATAQSDSTPAARDGPAVQRVCRSLCGVMGVLGAMGGVRARMGQHGWERGAFDHDGVLNVRRPCSIVIRAGASIDRLGMSWGLAGLKRVGAGSIDRGGGP